MEFSALHQRADSLFFFFTGDPFIRQIGQIAQFQYKQKRKDDKTWFLSELRWLYWNYLESSLSVFVSTIGDKTSWENS